jgi:hypothetical protein
MNENEEDLPILAIDPGTTQTAYAIYAPDTASLLDFGILDNAAMLGHLDTIAENYPVMHMAIEMMASMGMAVGQTVLETATWIGRYIQSWVTAPGHTYELIYRVDEKLHLCGTPRAKDANIRQSIMDRYGSTRQAVIGTKKNPGPLYGVSKDVWAAIAVALVAAEMPPEQRRAKGGLTL